MLSGVKPLAAFLFPNSEDERISLGSQPFARHVAKGTFIRRDRIFDRDGVTLCLLLFSLPGEEWRFKAYDLMWSLADKQGWNDTLERMQGTLLGYEDWQNDWHIANRDHYRIYGN